MEQGDSGGKEGMHLKSPYPVGLISMVHICV